MRKVIIGVCILYFLLLCIFAFLYIAISLYIPDSFNINFGDLSGAATALYFGVVVMGTVGFGDIYPVSWLARMVVSIQIFLSFLFHATIIGVLASYIARRCLV